MAEFVQKSVEEMLPELESMETLKLFDNEEIRCILKKRKACEYRLRRRSKLKSDFQQYIKYEIDVLDLVRERRKTTRCYNQKEEVDYPIIHRIHRLFRMACYRFQSDVDLWVDHIEFCIKTQEKTSVSKIITRMMQVHSSKPLLWIKCAKYELDVNSSIDNARFLLQRGLRFHPNCDRLWQEYFRLELLNSEKVRKRAEVLESGLVKPTTEEPDINDAVLNGQVALVVFKHALDSIQNTVDSCIKFLKIATLFPFAAHIEDEIFNYLVSHHDDSEIVWEAKVMRIQAQINHLVKASATANRDIEVQTLHNQCLAIYQEAVLRIPTVLMYDKFIDYCTKRLQSGSAVAREKQFEQIKSIWQEACQKKCISEKNGHEWLARLSYEGQLPHLLEAGEQLLQLYPTSCQLWHQYLGALAILGDHNGLMKAFRQALDSCQGEDIMLLWDLMYGYFKVQRPQEMDQFLKMGEGRQKNITTTCRSWSLDWAMLQGGLSATRLVYQRMKSIPPYNLDFFNRYIGLVQTKVDPKKKVLKKVFEEALQHFGNSSCEIWLKYMALFEDDPISVGKLYSRALSSLPKDLTEDFIKQATVKHFST